MNNKRYYLVAWLAFVVPNILASQEAIEFETVQIQQEDGGLTEFHTSSQVEPIFTYIEKAVSDGRIVNTLLQGDRFLAGQPLVQVSTQELNFIQQALETEKRYLQTEFELLNRQVVREQQLITRKATSQESMDLKSLALVKIDKQIQLLNEKIAENKWLIDESRYFAPFDGVVTRQYFSLGAAYEKGDVLLEAASIDAKRVVIDIPSELASNGSLSTELFYKGLRYSIQELKVFPSNLSRSITFRGAFDVSGLPINIGERVSVVLRSLDITPIFKVPASSVFQYKKNSNVFIVRDGQAEMHQVQILRESTNELLIQGPTLESNQQLLLNGQQYLASEQ